MTTSYEQGNAAEKRVAAIGGYQIPGSGNGKFLKLDVRDRFKFIFSVKSSRMIRDTALRAIANLWREAVSGARGFQGHGDGARPACAFEIENEVLVLIRLEDYEELSTGEIGDLIRPSKAEIRRGHSRRSLLS